MQRKVILSIEDNPMNRKIIRDLLGTRFKIIEAFDGEAGVAMAMREKPDLILMDIQLPKLSGHEAAKLIKSNPELKDIPIIAITSYALSGNDKVAFDAGCNDYIAKPFRPKVLREMVEKYLG